MIFCITASVLRRRKLYYAREKYVFQGRVKIVAISFSIKGIPVFPNGVCEALILAFAALFLSWN